ncbi:hypothetical protein IVB34_20295 [Bradyrhizobium sp. 2]|uniref:hypothetical protein n=1 Tax=Bradyrhizobium sp. 2 TaxID=190045 RepID=UPI001FF87379|nr:hypothetical protein [Bradyrhizobium sp. 2]MCK1460645.1 hypothetical protein [Bradyrhizobium sp. 2]
MDADHPENGVLIPCRNTADTQADTQSAAESYLITSGSGNANGGANTQADTQTNTQTDTKKKEIKQNKDYALGFEDWYSVYPRKKQRQDAAKAFARLMSSGSIALSELIAKTRTFAAKWEKEPPERRQFIPYPASWLNSGEYADEIDGSAVEPPPSIRDPASFTDSDWQKRLAHFREGNDWLEAWGPEPGAPDCLVPARLTLSPVSDARGAA